MSDERYRTAERTYRATPDDTTARERFAREKRRRGIDTAIEELLVELAKKYEHYYVGDLKNTAFAVDKKRRSPRFIRLVQIQDFGPGWRRESAVLCFVDRHSGRLFKARKWNVPNRELTYGTVYDLDPVNYFRAGTGGLIRLVQTNENGIRILLDGGLA